MIRHISNEGGTVKKALLVCVLKNFVTNEGKVRIDNFLQLALRAFLFFALSFLTIQASHYALIARINYGIIASCTLISSPINCILCYLAFGEKLTPKIIVGTVIVLTGVVWVALSKGQEIEYTGVEEVAREEEKDLYRIFSIALAVSCGFINASRVF